MSLLRTKLEAHPSIKSIIPTLKTDTNGRWLIETTRKYIKQAKAHVDNTILELDNDLRDTLDSDGFEVMPNIALTSWGAQDIYNLVKTTNIKHPDPEKNLQAQRMVEATHYETDHHHTHIRTYKETKPEHHHTQ